MMKRELVRAVIKLAIIASVISLLAAYGQTDPNSAEGWMFKSKLLALLWVDALPAAAILVLLLATPWYLVKFFRSRRAKK
jgi:hypothetical protein